MSYKIGVVIQSRDGAAVGLRRCIELAKRLDGSLHVIDVTEPPSGWLIRARRDSPSEADRLRGRRDVMERFVSNVRADGIEVSVAVRGGRRIVELIGEVRDANVDLVALVSGETKRSSSSSEAFANRVVRKSPVPVLLLRPLVPSSSGTVIALDISAADGSEPLIDSLVRSGVSLSSVSAPLAIVHVLEVDERAAAKDTGIDELARSAMRSHRAKLEALVEDIGWPADIDVVVRVGRPTAEIAAVAAERRAELLVVGTVSRSGPAGLMIGNTAEAILREVSCSVLAVKPPGFRSPLE